MNRPAGGVAVERTRFKRKDVPELLSWIGTETDIVQWNGAAFTWPLTTQQFRRHLLDAPERCACWLRTRNWE